MDSIEKLMKMFGAPMTREEYVLFNGLGKQPTAEEEAEFPERFQLVEDPPKPNLKSPVGKSPAKPKSFQTPDIVLGAKQIPNPKNIKPLWDTDNPPPVPMVGGAKPDISNSSGVKMNVNNATQNWDIAQPRLQ